MKIKTYIPCSKVAVGSTDAAYRLSNILNGFESNILNRKVLNHIHAYFATHKKLSKAIRCTDAKKSVGKLLIESIKFTPTCIKYMNGAPSELIENAIKAIKCAYVRDLFFRDHPINYGRTD